MTITVTDYLDVVSSWCFWSEPTWGGMKRCYDGRVQFQWKIALMDPLVCQLHASRSKWFYRRSGMMMRSAFMLTLTGTIQIFPSGSRRIVWPSRKRFWFQGIVSGSRCSSHACGRKKRRCWNTAPKSRQKLPGIEAGKLARARGKSFGG